MKDLIGYVDDLKRVCGSDYKAAQRLGVAKATISKLRTRKELSEDLAVKIAAIINVDLSDLLLAAQIEKSEGPVKEAWEKISKRAGIAAGWLIAVNNALPEFAEILKNATDTALCILC